MNCCLLIVYEKAVLEAVAEVSETLLTVAWEVEEVA